MSNLPLSKIAEFSDDLFESWRARVPIEPLTERESNIALEDTYRIQEHVIQRRLALGDRIVGKKIGLTSRVVQQSLGVSEPDFGQLLASMVATDSVPAAQLIQ